MAILAFLPIGGNRPTHPEFEPRTLWSLTNAFTSAFKDLEPLPQFQATAKLAGFLRAVQIGRDQRDEA
ncbi:hypothetical protein SBA3_2440007 [Candidatus Sulfopaludibacter sp. SbA3]|nr:hypothetical protein SBA3_2440007 [Candidatus Sulfopaludibacter sp. SbA3]